MGFRNYLLYLESKKEKGRQRFIETILLIDEASKYCILADGKTRYYLKINDQLVRKGTDEIFSIVLKQFERETIVDTDEDGYCRMLLKKCEQGTMDVKDRDAFVNIFSNKCILYCRDEPGFFAILLKKCCQEPLDDKDADALFRILLKNCELEDKTYLLRKIEHEWLAILLEKSRLGTMEDIKNLEEHGKPIPLLSFPSFPAGLKAQDKPSHTSIFWELLKKGLPLSGKAVSLFIPVSDVVVNAAVQMGAFFLQPNDVMVAIKEVEGKIERKRVSDWMEFISKDVKTITEEFQQLENPTLSEEYRRNTVMSCKFKLHEIYNAFTNMKIYYLNKMVFAPYFVQFVSFYIDFCICSVLMVPELKTELVQKLENLKEYIIEYRETVVSERIKAVRHTGEDLGALLSDAIKVVGTLRIATKYASEQVIDSTYHGKDGLESREFYARIAVHHEYYDSDDDGKNLYNNYVGEIRKLYDEYFTKQVNRIEEFLLHVQLK